MAFQHLPQWLRFCPAQCLVQVLLPFPRNPIPVSVNRHRDGVMPELLLHLCRAIVVHEQDACVCVTEIVWVPDGSQFCESTGALERFWYDLLCNPCDALGVVAYDDSIMRARPALHGLLLGH
jgi:hypothetical protein